ncbi:glycosyltransferase, partial [Desulfobaculum sp.]
GILYPLGDVDALRGGLRRLLDDAALRRRYGVAGRRRVEQDFSWTTNAEQYAVLCRDAMLEPASYKAG